jgi:2-polyprenyl-6-hydroxyphenyl methylase/3-demethylubiquinone-9 3-methyltransferase
MAIDNKIYDQMADSWWNEDGFLHGLKAINPVRFGYMKRVLLSDRGIDPAGVQVLEVGCGGGLLTEEFAQMGFQVTGLDPSQKSLEVARGHAAEMGLPIEYQLGTGEDIPFGNESYDIIYCCDVLEHVADLAKVISETARVLKPGGVYLYNTINRTFMSKLVVIKLLQEWAWSRVMPPDLHEWKMFIRPNELISLLSEHGLDNQELKGISPSASLFTLVQTILAVKSGRMNHVEGNAKMALAESRNPSMSPKN